MGTDPDRHARTTAEKHHRTGDPSLMPSHTRTYLGKTVFIQEEPKKVPVLNSVDYLQRHISILDAKATFCAP